MFFHGHHTSFHTTYTTELRLPIAIRAPLPTFTTGSLNFTGPYTRAHIIITVSNNISDSIITTVLGTRNCSIVNIALRLCSRNTTLGGGNTYYTKRSVRSTQQITRHVNVPRCILSCRGHFHRSIVSRFTSTCLTNTAPIPYVHYGRQIGFHSLLRATHSLSTSYVTAKRCVHHLSKPRKTRLRTTTSPNHSRDCFLFSAAHRRLRFLHFPLNKLTDGTSAQTLTTTRNLTITSGPSDRSVYFIPSNSCTTIVRGLHPNTTSPNRVISVSNAILNARHNIVRCAVKRHQNLNVNKLSAPLCIIHLSPTTHHIVINPHRTLTAQIVPITRIG